MTTATSPTADDIADYESVVRALRELSPNAGLTVLEALQGAASEAEDKTNRTLRASVTSTIYYYCFSYHLPLPKPPTQSVTSVQYYDPDDTLQTITASDYELLQSTRGPSWIEFQADYSFPNINSDRLTPVEVTIVRGWGSADSIPAAAKVGVRTLAEAIYDGNAAKRDDAMQILSSWKYRGLP